MTETDAERYRKEAEDCCRMAAKAISKPDKEAWLKLASEWLKLADDAERKGRPRL